MERPHGVPAEFDVMTVIFLGRPATTPDYSDEELDGLQRGAIRRMATPPAADS